MKKIALIDDRATRQEHFLEKTGIELDVYSEVLDNFVEERASNLLENILTNSFDLGDYDYIICHKSVENNTIVLSNLKNYCKMHGKTLVLFSGGISVNYYDNSEFELLELNSKTLYSHNLPLFLRAAQDGCEDIMMLCYGEKWKQNIVANVLEKTNKLLSKFEEEKIVYQRFANFVDIEKLSKIEHNFFELAIDNNRILKADIVHLKESLEGYFKHNEVAHNEKSTIFIHSGNLAINPEQELYFLSDENVDEYINTKIISLIAQKEFDTIFIKDNLSSNYLELYGLRVAYHIRLSPELMEKRFAPIVIISDFDGDALNRFTKEANILFTEGVYLCKNTKEEIQRYQSLELKGLTNLDEFLSNIEVSPPKDTSGTHDIANKWSIYRWAKLLGATSDAIEKNKTDVENTLYFKYLNALNKKADNEPKKIFKPSKKGKVLLIDDEWNKGWADILKSALSGDGLEFEAFEYDFKDKSGFNLIVQPEYKKLREQIENADLVILDLRLLESDHENDDIDSYSGVKILQKIHEINAGIQVIMLTATSKGTTLEKLYEKKILGYIKKEHPEDKSIDTVENINKFVRLVNKGLGRRYLKEVFEIQKNILSLKHLTEDIRLEVGTIFEILDSNMENRFNFTVLTYAKIFESLSKLFIDENSMKYLDNQKSVGIYDHTANKINSFSTEKWYKNTQNRLHNTVFDRLGIKDEKTHKHICEIINCRNYIAHPNEKKPVGCKLVKNPNQQHILDWLQTILDILAKVVESRGTM